MYFNSNAQFGDLAFRIGLAEALTQGGLKSTLALVGQSVNPATVYEYTWLSYRAQSVLMASALSRWATQQPEANC